MKVNLLKVILAVILILCLLEWNYGFYQLVRFLGFVGFSILAYQEKEKQNSWFFIWLFSALLINPFLKVSLGKTIWNVIDVIWAVLLAVNVIYPQKENIVKNNLKTAEKENFNFKNAVFKYFFDEDLFTFYDFVKFDMINTKSVYHYEDLFNTEIEGVTTFFSIQEPNKLSYRDYYGRDYSRLKNNTLFAIFIFDYISTYSTNYASGIQSLSFKKIEIYKKTNDNNVNLVDVCNVEDLRN